MNVIVQADPSLILEFKKDLQEECAGFGEVKKVVIYDVRECFFSHFLLREISFFCNEVSLYSATC